MLRIRSAQSGFPCRHPRALSLLLSTSVFVLSFDTVARSQQEPGPDDFVGHPRLADTFGFSGLIISKVNDSLFGLSVGDFDGDSRMDLAAINNRESQITLFLQKREGSGPSTESSLTNPSFPSNRINELADETTFQRVAIPTDEAVASLAVGDLNRDGRDDIAYAGESGLLTIVLSEGPENGGSRLSASPGPETRLSFETLERIRLRGSVASSKAVWIADMDASGDPDLIIGTSTGISIYPQRLSPEGDAATGPPVKNTTLEFGDPVRIPGSNVSYDLEICDLDQDGHLDLITVLASSSWPFRVRFGRVGLEFTPESSRRFVPLRSYLFGDADGDGRPDVAAVRRQSGRLAVLRLEDVPRHTSFLAPLKRIDLTPDRGTNSSRGVLVDDLDGDGIDDLLLSEGEGARLLLFRGTRDGLSAIADIVPSLVRVMAPFAADLDGDGEAEIVVASAEERALGVSRFQNGRLSLPETYPLPEGELIAFSLEEDPRQGDPAEGPLTSRETRIWLAMERGSRRSRETIVGFISIDGDGELGSFEEIIKLDELPTRPDALALFDLDRSHGQDILLQLPSEMPRIGLDDGNRGFSFVDVDRVPGLGLLKGLDFSRMHFGDVDGDGTDEWLVPGPNFARAWSLEPGEAETQTRPRVILQRSLDDPNIRLECVAAVDFEADGKPEIVVTEKATQRLTVLGQDEGEVLADLDLFDLEPKSLRPADIDGDGREELILIGDNGLGILGAGSGSPGLTVAYELDPGIKDAFYDQIAIGDVNGDDRPDILISELRYRLLQIMAFDEGAWLSALKFRIYEEKFFERGDIQSREPREILVADVDGDRRQDVVLLIHDRILIYPQDP